MVQHGVAPFLECSSKGDKRFSAFYAKVEGISIEDLFQAKKAFANGMTNLRPQEAKMLQRTVKILNYEDCAEYYQQLWRQYLRENPELLKVLVKAKGLSDMFGQVGGVNQTTTLWNLRTEFITTGTI